VQLLRLPGFYLENLRMAQEKHTVRTIFMQKEQ